MRDRFGVLLLVSLLACFPARAAQADRASGERPGARSDRSTSVPIDGDEAAHGRHAVEQFVMVHPEDGCPGVSGRILEFPFPEGGPWSRLVVSHSGTDVFNVGFGMTELMVPNECTVGDFLPLRELSCGIGGIACGVWVAMGDIAFLSHGVESDTPLFLRWEK